MIKRFSLPGYYNHFNEIQVLLQYYKQHPDYFYPDRIIDSAYDLPPGLIWNGGRINLSNKHNKISYDQLFSFYHSIPNFHLRHTCTNMLLGEEEILNKECNNFLKKYVSQQDKIIVNNSVLYTYLRKNYSFEIIFSTTLCLDDIDTINKLSENNIYVLNYNYNNNDDYLRQLKHPEHIEILCGEPCVDNCPDRLQHYRTISKQQLGLPLDDNDIIQCRHRVMTEAITPQTEFDVIQNRANAIHNDRIEALAAQGFQYFKISGRFTSTLVFFKLISYYLILPEKREEAEKELCKEVAKYQLCQKLKLKLN